MDKVSGEYSLCSDSVTQVADMVQHLSASALPVVPWLMRTDMSRWVQEEEVDGNKA